MRMIHAVSLALLLGTWALRALGQDESTVATARQLGEEGLSAYDAGRYDEAAQKLLQAYGAVKVPTFARNAARALVKQGKLVAAAELYLQAMRLEPNELWRGDLQQQAQREAADERAALLPHIARLKIVIEGAEPKDVDITIDSTPVPMTLVGTDQFADPGTRNVMGKRGTEAVRQSIELKDGERGQVVLRFASTLAPPAVQPQPAAQPQPVPNPGVAPAIQPAPVTGPQRRTSNTRHTLGWVGIGVGAAGVTMGAVTGIMALVKRSQLHDSSCSGNDCYDPKDQSKMNSYNSLLPVSSVGFIAGGVVAAAGVTLLLWPEHRESKPNVTVVVDPSSLAVQGRF